MGLCQRDVDVFEEGLGSDALYAAGGLDEVVAGASGLFAAESVGKNEWFSELTRAHQKTGAVDGPLVFRIHGAIFHPWQGRFASGVSPFGFGGTWLLLEANACFEWSDCTRTKSAGQYHKNCATVEFPVADGMG